MPADKAYENANEHAAFNNKITTMAIGEEDGSSDVVIL